MSFLSREEFKQLANADLDKLYEYLTERFNAPLIKNHTYYGDEFKSFIIYMKNHHMLPFLRQLHWIF